MPGSQSDFDQESSVRPGDEYHRSHKQAGDCAGESRNEEHVAKQRDDDEGNQYRRAPAHSDGGVDITGSPLKDGQIGMHVPVISWITGELLLQLTRSVHYARQAARQNVQRGTNAGQQEDWRQGRLDEMSNVHGV